MFFYSFRKAKLRLSALLFLLIGACYSGFSQGNYELGFSLGATNFAGDIGKPFNPAATRAAAELRLGYHFNYELTWRNSVGFSWFSGSDSHVDDPLFESRGYSFSNYGVSFASVMEYYFMDFRKDKRETFSPYLFGGLGLFYQFADAQGGGRSVSLNPLGLSLPFGIGIKKKLSTFWDLGLEFSVVQYFSDNVDGSGDLGSTLFPVSGRPIKKEFNQELDRSFFFGITLTRQFYEIKCPRSAYLP